MTFFIGSKRQHSHVPAAKLAKYLEDLPMQAWPRGPYIEIQPLDFGDIGKIDQNLEAAKQICRSMGLQVQSLLGG